MCSAPCSIWFALKNKCCIFSDFFGCIIWFFNRSSIKLSGHLEADIGIEMCKSWLMNNFLQSFILHLWWPANVFLFEIKTQVASSIGIILYHIICYSYVHPQNHQIKFNERYFYPFFYKF